MPTQGLTKTVSKFLSAVSGSFIPVIGITLPVLLLATGAALETSNITRIQNHMQASMDAALIAVSLKAQTLEDDMEEAERQKILDEEFRNYYSANFSQFMFGNESYTVPDGDYVLKFDKEEDVADATVKYPYDTILMGALGKDKYILDTSGSAVLSTTPENYVIDIVMCIDATGSMQATLDAVKIQANSFNAELRKELDIGEEAEHIKIRVKPIFYRDWDDEYYRNRNYRGLPWYYGAYFRSFGDFYEGGLIEHNGFIDLDPNLSTNLTAAKQTAKFVNFIASERAAGGYDWPEGAGACLNEGIRSNWFDNQSDESREYFKIEKGEKIIEAGEKTPPGKYSVVSTIPIIVFWTDATINSLKRSKDYLSKSTPTSYEAFQNLWRNKNTINQDRKLLIHFGPGSGQGWNNVKIWDRYFYGGTLIEGNEKGVKLIADQIKKHVPDFLRLSS